MSALFSLSFQGEPEFLGAVGEAERRQVPLLAFPNRPSHEAIRSPGYRAFKVAPLSSGGLLLAAISNRGARDRFGRPVLSCTGYIADPGRLSGSFRDIGAVLKALAEWTPSEGMAEFEHRVERLSVMTDPAAFERMFGYLRSHPRFVANAAAALTRRESDLYFRRGESDLDELSTVLAILPLKYIKRLCLATGSVDGEGREPALGLIESSSPNSLAGGLLRRIGRLWRRGPNRPRVRFSSKTVEGIGESPLTPVVDAVLDPFDWPGTDPQKRFGILLDCLNARGPGGKMKTPFESVRELEQMRRTVRRLEEFTRAVERLE